MAQVLDKVYKCHTCSAEIKLQRKDDNSGWNRYNLDGTIHYDSKKKPVVSTVAVSQTNVSQLESKIDALITEVQALRMELQKRN